jgi:hypothetical protein
MAPVIISFLEHCHVLMLDFLYKTAAWEFLRLVVTTEKRTAFKSVGLHIILKTMTGRHSLSKAQDFDLAYYSAQKVESLKKLSLLYIKFFERDALP